MLKRLSIWTLSVLIVMTAVNCSKDSTNPTEPQKQEPPEIAAKEIKTPQKLQQSSDPNAQLTAAYISMANSFRDLAGGFMQPPPGLNKLMQQADMSGDTPVWRRTWTDGALTVIMEIFDAGDKYLWDIRMNGTDGEYVYDNWLFIHAEQTKNGQNGFMTIYEDLTTKAAGTWTWMEDAQHNYKLTVLLNNVYNSVKLIAEAHPDESGRIEFYNGQNNTFVLQFKAEWNADGSGQWWSYENGQENASGSWS